MKKLKKLELRKLCQGDFEGLCHTAFRLTGDWDSPTSRISRILKVCFQTCLQHVLEDRYALLNPRVNLFQEKEYGTGLWAATQLLGKYDLTTKEFSYGFPISTRTGKKPIITTRVYQLTDNILLLAVHGLQLTLVTFGDVGEGELIEQMGEIYRLLPQPVQGGMGYQVPFRGDKNLCLPPYEEIVKLTKETTDTSHEKIFGAQIYFDLWDVESIRNFPVI